jgi:hypothetical protein
MIQFIRLGLRVAQRYAELPALWVFGFLILFGYIGVMAFAITTGQYIPEANAAFLHFFIELPLGIKVDPESLRLGTEHLTKLFFFWGTAYFLIAEALSFILSRVTKKKLGHPRIWLLGIIAGGYTILMIAAYWFFQKEGGQTNGIWSVAVFLVVVAAASLGVSYLLGRWEQKFADSLKHPQH